MVVLDDHLLRDWLAGGDPALRAAVGDGAVATTNLWYARLCKSAAGFGGGALLGHWSDRERDALVSALTVLPLTVAVLPMWELGWRMGQLIVGFGRLSTLGAEAVAATERLDGGLLVSSRDDGPQIRRCAERLGIDYQTLPR